MGSYLSSFCRGHALECQVHQFWLYVCRQYKENLNDFSNSILIAKKACSIMCILMFLPPLALLHSVSHFQTTSVPQCCGSRQTEECWRQIHSSEGTCISLGHLSITLSLRSHTGTDFATWQTVECLWSSIAEPTSSLRCSFAFCQNMSSLDCLPP